MASFTKYALNLSLFFAIFLARFGHGFSAIPTIEINPKILNKSGDIVRIEWKGIESPSNLDWLGIYSPPNSSDSNFIGYVFLSTCENWRSGSCGVDLPLINLRSNYQFRIFRWNESEIDRKRVDEDHNPLPGTLHLLARSKELGFLNFNDPAQIHLSFTENDDEMRVIFVTKDGLRSYVKYGRDEDELEEIAETEVRSYGRSDMCDSPANSDVGWRDPGIIHDGVMRNLKPGKRYYYQVGSDTGGWSGIHSFMSQDRDSDETIAFLFGDMGTWVPYNTLIRVQEESKSTVKWILRDIEALGNKPSLISHIGDISYARGYSWLWDSFFTQIETIASKVPYHVCIGNHEYDWPLQPWKPSWASTVYGTDGGGECGVPYSLKFNMPGNSSEPTGNGSPATRNLYYSFDLGVVHFLYFSTETNFLPGSNQYEFIKRDLESINREKTPFVVVQGHRPMYTTSNEARDAPLRERLLESLEPLLVKHRVSLVLWGHVHRYERFCPLRNYSCGSMGSDAGWDLPIHVVIGMGGQDWQPIWEPRPDHRNDPIFPQPQRSLYRGGEFGYVRLVAKREKLTLTYIGNHDGEPHDTVDILLKELHGTAAAADSTANIWFVFVKGGSLWLLGAFLGYVVGFVSRARREAAHKRSWTAVKADDT